MNLPVVYAALAATIILVVALTTYAWHDYHTRPDKYGYQPGERTQRRRTLTHPQRGDTHQPIRQWPRSWIRR